MPEQLLHRPDVVPSLEQIRREAMAQGVRTNWLHDTRPSPGLAKRPLRHRLVDMVALRWAEARIVADPRGRKHPLPAPFPVGIGVLARQGMRQLHAAETCLQIALVKAAHPIEVLQQRVLTAAASIVTRSLSPLPSRTRISFLVKSMSFTRNRKHSINRSPEP